MAAEIKTYLVDGSGNPDPYAPPISKKSLQQYDNYQIYDIYCIDINYKTTSSTTITNQTKQLIHPIAVQSYSPDGIPIDFFDLAIKKYP